MAGLTRGGAACAVALLLFVGPAAPAAAQGNGRGNAHGLAKKNVSSSAPSGSVSDHDGSIPGLGFRNFGSWLDDATVAAEGAGFVSLAVGYWRTPSFSEFDFPVLDGALSVHRRVQVGISAPFYHLSEPGAPVARGLGDVYMSVKVQLKDPAGHAAGFAVSPVVEVLSAPLPGEEGRVHWGIPVSMELQRGSWRTYGATGYFSRGALFASAALEKAVSPRAWVTGSVSHSYSARRDDLSFALALSKNRTDVSGAVAFAVRPELAVFGSVGRTLSGEDASAAPLMFTTGVSVSFDR